MSSWEESHQPGDDELRRAKEIMKGEQPLMSETVDTSVKLFRGAYRGGKFEEEARVKELTGADEEAIARMLGGSTPNQYVNAVLAHGVSHIGRYELEKMNAQERMGIIDTLLVGEKEWLFLNILRVTYGDERTTPVICTACEAANEVFFSLVDDVPVKKMEDPQRLTYDFTSRNGSRIEYRLVTGADQAEADRRPHTSTPEQNTIILSRVIESVDGRSVVDPLAWARNLGSLDRRNLMRDLTAHQPGPYFEEVKLPCTACGAENLFQPSWADLL